MPIQVIRIGRERFTVGEALFQPSILGLEAHGIVEQLVRSISTVSSENQKQLLENTVLCGGTTSMTGENHRLLSVKCLDNGGALFLLINLISHNHEYLPQSC